MAGSIWKGYPMQLPAWNEQTWSSTHIREDCSLYEPVYYSYMLGFQDPVEAGDTIPRLSVKAWSIQENTSLAWVVSPTAPGSGQPLQGAVVLASAPAPYSSDYITLSGSDDLSQHVGKYLYLTMWDEDEGAPSSGYSRIDDAACLAPLPSATAIVTITVGGDCCDGPFEPTAGYPAPPPAPAPDDPAQPAADGLPNCDCYDDTSGNRTLGELSSAIMGLMGFVDTLKDGPQKTLCQMRCSVEEAINLGADDGVERMTLADIRRNVTRMSGFSANIPTPPGYTEMVDTLINQAQQQLWRRLEMSRSNEGVVPGWLVDESDLSTVDGTLVQTMATALVKSQYGRPDAEAFAQYTESMVAATAEKQTPISDKQIDNALRRARYTVWNRAEPLPPMEGDNDLSTIHFLPIELLAIANLKERVGHKDARNYRSDYERYVTEDERRNPAGRADVVRSALISAQNQLHQQYDALRTERFYSWELQAGVRMYGIGDNDSDCSKRLDPHKVRWVGIERDGDWRPLMKGIPPEMYSREQKGWPSRYEIRQCIEVYPIPEQADGRLVIKGHFGLEPFESDSDRTTIDSEAVYLFALATVKAHFKHGDASAARADANNYVGNLTAGSHQTARYHPNAITYTRGRPDPVPRDGWLP